MFDDTDGPVSVESLVGKIEGPHIAEADIEIREVEFCLSDRLLCKIDADRTKTGLGQRLDFVAASAATLQYPRAGAQVTTGHCDYIIAPIPARRFALLVPVLVPELRRRLLV